MKLKVLEGSQVGAEVPVPGPKFFVGRGEDCQLRPHSDMVSRHHCVLLIEQGYVAIRDFGSKNGTYVNGERVVGEQTLKAGDTLVIGPLKFEVLLTHTIGGPKLSKVKDVKEAAGRTAARGSGGEIDINDWLNDDVENLTVTAGRETIDLDSSSVRLGEEGSVSDTTAMDAPQATSLTRQSEEHTRIDAEPSKPTPNTNPGGLPPAPVVKSKDTQSAATDVLRQLRKKQMQQPKKK
ncbi:MAG: FHA domain-containing protein [Planctomycetes bacterium]|nr:FHA domain-containing protein [Planctomycetota bacterium]